MNLFSIIALILIIGLVILVHETGHFLLAKLNGVGIIEFSVGMGPRVFTRVKNGTRYSIKALPFGGSCRMLGDSMGVVDPDAEPIADSEHSFDQKSVWARISIVLAGPVFNFILAFVLAVIVLNFAGSDKPYITGVMEGYPAEAAGLQAGDRICSVNGNKVHIFRDLQLYVEMNPGKTLNLTYERDGQKTSAELVPLYSEEDARYYMGVYSEGRTKLTWYECLEYSAFEVRYNIVAVVKSLGMVFTGRLPVTSFSGPVGIATTVNDIVEDVKEESAGQPFSDLAMSMFLTLTNFTVLISANLGVMNLLPIPALDGGRLVFLIIEAVRRKPVPKEKEAIVQFAGVIFLLFFMIFVLFNDIRQAFLGLALLLP